MGTDYIKATVRQRIPAACLAPIERWLLTRIFETEERGGFFVFHGCWEYGTISCHYGVSPDDKFREALAASRELCPELCAEFDFLNKSNEFQGAIDYKRIFQSIVRRHPDVLHHISIEDFDCNTSSEFSCETLTIITAQSIMSIDSLGEIYQRPWSPYVSSLLKMYRTSPKFHA
jgi:hypothetical protein